ncbi:MAG: carbohydrate ABC transporter permease [Planctomycetota bacterium]|jgi:multiple sugar transport system permease protein
MTTAPKQWPRWVPGLLWTAPWWLGFLLFLAAPMVISAYVSLCDYPLLQPPVYVGADNYRELVQDPIFHKVLVNTFVYAAFAIPLGTVLSVVLASLLNQRVRGQAVFRTCIFVPTVVPIVATAVVWLWMLNPQFGLINHGLRLLGIEGPTWLASPGWAMTSLVLVSLWGVGSPVVIYLAGLQEIPDTLYEAARLDGAGALRQFWHVTLPGLSPVILFNIVIAIIVTWQVFALPYVMMKGSPGPERSTYFYTMYLFDNAFRFLKMGYASAMAWIQFLIILGLTGLVFLRSRRTVHYRGA